MEAGTSLENSLTELVSGVAAMGQFFTGGSALSSFGTVGYSNNYALITLQEVMLSYLYTGNGIFQTAIQLPVYDALSKGIEIDSPEMSSYEIEDLIEWFETAMGEDQDEQSPMDAVINMFSWNRLFGGAGIIINTNQNPEEPLNPMQLNSSDLALYDVERWQLESGLYNQYFDEFSQWDSSSVEYFYVNGVKIHKSRVMVAKGKKAPYRIKKSLRGWGMSEGERMIRDLNIYLKTQDVLYEILDESKIDVYKIKNLASKLLTKGSTNAIKNRLILTNELKNYLGAIALDSEEDFEQKSMTFSGLAEVMRENRMGIASALRIPMTKLFGLSASGFNTGESDLENYNSFIESDLRRPMKPTIRKVLNLRLMQKYNYVPQYRIKYPSLRVLSAVEEEQVKSSQSTRAFGMYDRGLYNSQEVMQTGRKEGWIEIETKAEKGLLSDRPEPPFDGEFISGPTVEKAEEKAQSTVEMQQDVV